MKITKNNFWGWRASVRDLSDSNRAHIPSLLIFTKIFVIIYIVNETENFIVRNINGKLTFSKIYDIIYV